MLSSIRKPQSRFSTDVILGIASTVRRHVASFLSVVIVLGTISAGWSRHATAEEESKSNPGRKNLLLIAGNPSHGFGSHEHYAGLRILADTLATVPDLDVKVVRGWPEKESLIDAADSIVIYSDGGGGHPALPHLEALSKKLDQGCGLVCLHYAVEVPKGEPGEHWLKYLGGYFETDWSVNPHWRAEFASLPDHPIAEGIEPFSIQDEWYFHMRFVDQKKGVTPILQSVAPESTMRRSDGPHSGNPAVRKSVAAGESQTLAWAFDRPDGGRSFGFTGGHFHWNWGNPTMRRLVANAILWTAGGEVPTGGVGAEKLNVDRLLENQDFPKPDDFDAEATAQEYQLSLRKTSKNDAVAISGPVASVGMPRQLFLSPIVTTDTEGHSIDIRTEIGTSTDLFLIVTDAGDSFACDWANWVNPTLVGPAGRLSMLELDWIKATSGFGKVHKNANAVGQPASVNGQEIDAPVIGMHANGMIHFKVPEGYDSLEVTAALDSGGTSQNGGRSTSVRFAVYADAAPVVSEIDQGVAVSQRDPANALAGIDIAPGLQATLSVSEPTVTNLTNLDIDDRGRVWVCDVMNYRGNNGSRPEGDRILILEDTTGDGVMDKVKTFYQGTDIDSAMGICVLGNEVIVSAAPYIWRFIDDDGDDVADRKIAMFTQTGQPQHDHSNHSFIFGPDGKFYWNFGNTGLHVKDADGNVVVDIHGRPVIDNGKPFFGGMVFRCEPDGSGFEVLAHNFRNNWETTVDSFGTLWQSDNDDDGNRGTRINFVMEHGNYGYRDEMTGAAWQAERINMESEIPLRHWHLNDPGVVPNLLQTGAGSPCGICFYEADLLPERYRNQMIHCDPGPNVVRAYPVTPDGAGYQATIEPLMTGTRDQWFRPVDVCVAPDGSLFVTDWYDPGVGGHRQDDLHRGRLFRIAPPGVGYQVPKFDYSTVDGAIAALRNPNLSVRYKAWNSLHAMGADAEAGLLKLYHDPAPHQRARALWLLGKIAGRGEHYVKLALGDKDENIRMTAIRLMRQLDLVPAEVLANIADDPSPAVRREALVALRYDTSDAMPELWSRLAMRHDGQDRWYLEALGVASDVRPSDCYRSFIKTVGNDWRKSAHADVIWRVRASEAVEQLVGLIADPAIELAATDRYFRSLDFHAESARVHWLQTVLINPTFATMAKDEMTQRRNDAILVRASERVPAEKRSEAPEVKQAVLRHLQTLKGTPDFLKMVERFDIKGVNDTLLAMTLSTDNDSLSVDALGFLMRDDEAIRSVVSVIATGAESDATRLARLLGLLATPNAIAILGDSVQNAEIPYPTRSAAVRGLAANLLGAKRLLQLAESGDLSPDTRLLAGGLLGRNDNEEIRQTAAKLLPLPAQADSAPVPPIDELASMEGDAGRGEVLFRGKATCSNCHIVSGFGKQVGPDLSEIGGKLSPEAMYVSILDPSAGISHNYETYIALLDSGQVINGLMVSETDDEVTLRTAEAIDRTVSRDEIVEMKKSEKSIMPDELHLTVDRQGLVDIVHYMKTLLKKD